MTSPSIVRSVQRHETYYIPTGDLSILVQNFQFRVHRYFFERESLFFRKELSKPTSPGAKPQGSSDSNSFILDDVEPYAFSRFCWVFYNPRYSIYDDASITDWQAILQLAHMWMFAEVKKLAIRELEKRPYEMTAVKRIKLYHENEVDRSLLISRYAALCEREDPLTIEEGLDLGMETALMIAKGREEIRANKLPSGLRSPLTPTITGEEVKVFVRELFGLDPSSSPDEEFSRGPIFNDISPPVRGSTPTPSRARPNGVLKSKVNGTPTKPQVVTTVTPTPTVPLTMGLTNGQTSGGLAVTQTQTPGPSTMEKPVSTPMPTPMPTETKKETSFNSTETKPPPPPSLPQSQLPPPTPTGAQQKAKSKADKKKADKKAKDAAEKAEREAKEKEEREAKEKEERESKEREKAEQLAKEKKEEEERQAKLEEERSEKERQEEKARQEKERMEQEKLEKERLEQERLEQERLEQERLEQERLEQERLEKERLEEHERLETQRLEKERLEQERLAAEKAQEEKKLADEAAKATQSQQEPVAPPPLTIPTTTPSSSNPSKKKKKKKNQASLATPTVEVSTPVEPKEPLPTSTTTPDQQPLPPQAQEEGGRTDEKEEGGRRVENVVKEGEGGAGVEGEKESKDDEPVVVATGGELVKEKVESAELAGGETDVNDTTMKTTGDTDVDVKAETTETTQAEPETTQEPVATTQKTEEKEEEKVEPAPETKPEEVKADDPSGVPQGGTANLLDLSDPSSASNESGEKDDNPRPSTPPLSAGVPLVDLASSATDRAPLLAELPPTPSATQQTTTNANTTTTIDTQRPPMTPVTPKDQKQPSPSAWGRSPTNNVRQNSWGKALQSPVSPSVPKKAGFGIGWGSFVSSILGDDDDEEKNKRHASPPWSHGNSNNV